jgi:hypothetical protein
MEVNSSPLAFAETSSLQQWTFTIKYNNGEVLAEIDRNWRGFGFEVFLIFMW